jgi:hypothetical protein
MLLYVEQHHVTMHHMQKEKKRKCGAQVSKTAHKHRAPRERWDQSRATTRTCATQTRTHTHTHTTKRMQPRTKCGGSASAHTQADKPHKKRHIYKKKISQRESTKTRTDVADGRDSLLL